MTEETIMSSISREERVALALAEADGAAQGNRYALTAYRAGVGMTIDYWNALSRAAIAALSPDERALDDAVATIAAVRATAVSEEWGESAAHFHKLCGETLARISTTKAERT